MFCYRKIELAIWMRFFQCIVLCLLWFLQPYWIVVKGLIRNLQGLSTFNFSIRHQYIVKQTGYKIIESHQLGVSSVLIYLYCQILRLDYRGHAAQNFQSRKFTLWRYYIKGLVLQGFVFINTEKNKQANMKNRNLQILATFHQLFMDFGNVRNLLLFFTTVNKINSTFRESMLV